ncbi:hypothetical protein HanPSC8_Chr04g0151391 [Helianthus annuus]|nr:hypothetical protein HanPSC8_Chr04g0151391 [Helianthus annuus]
MVTDLPTDSGLLGGGLRGGITSAVGRTVEYPPSALFKPFQLTVQAVCRCFLCRFHHMSKPFDCTCSNKVTVPRQTTFKPGQQERAAVFHTCDKHQNTFKLFLTLEQLT